ncbi:MAG: hypothetical protein JWM43_2087 [Acidobacteriaceae bacterium]|nr:hypothetical protein [Acidobacteriaceae bacterium]
MPSRKSLPVCLRPLLLISLLLLFLPFRSPGQSTHKQSTSVKPSDARETIAELPPGSLSQAPEAAGEGNLFRGFNAGITIAGIHDSVVGWSTLATPSVGYTFNDTFSMDASIPIYMYRLAQSLSARPRPTQLLVNQRAELSDVVLGLHAQFAPKLFVYQATFAVTAPTGDEKYGLTTGRCTFDLNNRFERTYGRLTPNLELGIGDSSYLVNRTVNKNYTSLGPISHFQIGLAVELLRGAFFETDVYENLPIGDQKIYGPSRNGRATIVTGHSVTEDNGFTNSLDIPLDRHTSLTSYYSRSLRLKIDSVAFGVTYILRPAPLPPQESSLDDLFR